MLVSSTFTRDAGKHKPASGFGFSTRKGTAGSGVRQLARLLYYTPIALAMTESPLVTRVFKSLPDGLQRKLTNILAKYNITLLLKFYFGEGNVLREKGWFKSERRGFPVDG